MSKFWIKVKNWLLTTGPKPGKLEYRKRLLGGRSKYVILEYPCGIIVKGEFQDIVAHVNEMYDDIQKELEEEDGM